MSSDKYIHTQVENKIYAYWEKKNLFKPKKNKKQFSIVIPPPNVTGSLHMGHALNNTIQDLLTRFHRMNNYETLWQPGTDHAGIATQALVEKKLAKENINKQDLGREKFINKVWEWKNEYGDIIINQLKKLGCSCDWSRNAFTMDENLSKSVIKVFVEMYNKGLIYKSRKLVNWDTVLKTAISDLEVDQREVNSKLYYIKYPIEDTEDFITIATTRPETMLGDTAVAVHPKDKRFKKYLGKNVILPLTTRKVKIIADEYADPEQGTGAVKITPAHDFNDYDVGKRNKLEIINIFTEDGKINDNAPSEYIGLDRFEARRKIIIKLKELEIFEKEESIKNKVPYGDRSNSIIEPYLTEQWFADAKKLSVKAKKIVKSKKTKFYPGNWSKTYFQWMNNIEPWCISRQLWWGHQIPAWYGPDKKFFVSETIEDAKKQALEFYGKNVDLERKVLRQGSRLIQMGMNPKDEWILAEALYLSRLATQRLLIERSSESAIALLLEADKLLLKFDDANLAHVRNALSKEIASLRTLNKIDAQGIIFELNAISEEVNKLSILNLLSTQKDTSKTDNKEEVENLENKKQLNLGKFFRNFGEQLEDAIKVRRFDSDIQPLITEHDLSVVRNNIDLHFQQAIYSVMREEKDLFELSLKNIVADLKNYFHMNPKSSNLLQRIQQISLLSIEQKLPKIGYSSELLNSYISARNEELLNSVTSKNSDY